MTLGEAPYKLQFGLNRTTMSVGFAKFPGESQLGLTFLLDVVVKILYVFINVRLAIVRSK